MGVNCFGNFIFLASAYEGEESASQTVYGQHTNFNGLEAIQSGSEDTRPVS